MWRFLLAAAFALAGTPPAPVKSSAVAAAKTSASVPRKHYVEDHRTIVNGRIVVEDGDDDADVVEQLNKEEQQRKAQASPHQITTGFDRPTEKPKPVHHTRTVVQQQCAGWASTAVDVECRVAAKALVKANTTQQTADADFATFAQSGKAEVVVADHDEALGDWLLKFVPARAVTIYDEAGEARGAEKLSSLGATEYTPPRIGGSAYAYVKYILDRYDSLPDVVVFLPHKPGPEAQAALNALHLDGHFRYASLASQATQCTCLDLAAAPTEEARGGGADGGLLSDLTREWQMTYEKEFGPESTLGDRWCVDCGAEFAASKAAIEQHPRSFYRQLLERIVREEGGERHGALQNFWSALFDLHRAFPDAVLVGAEAERILKRQHGFGLPAPRKEGERSLGQHQDAGAPKNLAKLFCYMVVRPGTREVGLLRAQAELGDGLTGCNAFKVYSNVTDLEGVPATKAFEGSMEEGGARQRFETLHHFMFQHEPRPWHQPRHGADWVVKVEPGTVWSVSHLRAILPRTTDPVYYASDGVGIFGGGLEVVSAAAMDKYARGHATCEDTLSYENTAEDKFLDLCLSKLGVPSKTRPDLIRSTAGLTPKACGDASTVAFPRFHVREEYIQCWHELHEALDKAPPATPAAEVARTAATSTTPVPEEKNKRDTRIAEDMKRLRDQIHTSHTMEEEDLDMSEKAAGEAADVPLEMHEPKGPQPKRRIHVPHPPAAMRHIRKER